MNTILKYLFRVLNSCEIFFSVSNNIPYLAQETFLHQNIENFKRACKVKK